jgi:hypothetical protein
MSETTGRSIERRRAPRAETTFPIRITEQGEARPATVKNLSSSGLCCTYPEAIREMTLVGMTLELPGEAGVHELRGAVVRCDKLRGQTPPTYEIAIYFTEITPGTRVALSKFVSAQTVTQ